MAVRLRRKGQRLSLATVGDSLQRRRQPAPEKKAHVCLECLTHSVDMVLFRA